MELYSCTECEWEGNRETVEYDYEYSDFSGKEYIYYFCPECGETVEKWSIDDIYKEYILSDDKEFITEFIILNAKDFIKHNIYGIDVWLKVFENEEYVINKLKLI